MLRRTEGSRRRSSLEVSALLLTGDTFFLVVFGVVCGWAFVFPLLLLLPLALIGSVGELVGDAVGSSSENFGTGSDTYNTMLTTVNYDFI